MSGPLSMRRLTALLSISLLFSLCVFLTCASAAETPTHQQPDAAADRQAAFYRIAVLTAQAEAALELLTFAYHCAGDGSAALSERYDIQFEAYARSEALLAVRRMWPHILAFSPALPQYYWPLRFQLGRIARAHGELVCGSKIRHARNRWWYALRGTPSGADSPDAQVRRKDRLDHLNRLASLSRIRLALAASYRLTCHSISMANAPLTWYPSGLIVLEHAIRSTFAAIRSAPAPPPQPPGALHLWRGVGRAIYDWRVGIDEYYADGRRRDICGSVLRNIAPGSYYSWLYDFAGAAAAGSADLLLQWTQLELALGIACRTDDADILALAAAAVSSALTARGDGVEADRGLERRRDEIAQLVEAWLPTRAELADGEFGELPCPHDARAAVSSLLDAAARRQPAFTAE